jgi:hypothetical protein
MTLSHSLSPGWQEMLRALLEQFDSAPKDLAFRIRPERIATTNGHHKLGMLEILRICPLPYFSAMIQYVRGIPLIGYTNNTSGLRGSQKVQLTSSGRLRILDKSNKY